MKKEGENEEKMRIEQVSLAGNSEIRSIFSLSKSWFGRKRTQKLSFSQHGQKKRDRRRLEMEERVAVTLTIDALAGRRAGLAAITSREMQRN